MKGSQRARDRPARQGRRACRGCARKRGRACVSRGAPQQASAREGFRKRGGAGARESGALAKGRKKLCADCVVCDTAARAVPALEKQFASTSSDGPSGVGRLTLVPRPAAGLLPLSAAPRTFVARSHASSTKHNRPHPSPPTRALLRPIHRFHPENPCFSFVPSPPGRDRKTCSFFFLGPGRPSFEAHTHTRAARPSPAESAAFVAMQTEVRRAPPIAPP